MGEKILIEAFDVPTSFVAELIRVIFEAGGQPVVSTYQMPVLHALMERTERVRITGPGTDLAFSKKGIPTIPCAGEHNIPDGEMFTCPVRDSVEGVISFNTETLYRGQLFSGIQLEFKKGRIVR